MRLSEQQKANLKKATSWTLRKAAIGLRGAGKGIHWLADKAADSATTTAWKLKDKPKDA